MLKTILMGLAALFRASHPDQAYCKEHGYFISPLRGVEGCKRRDCPKCVMNKLRAHGIEIKTPA